MIDSIFITLRIESTVCTSLNLTVPLLASLMKVLRLIKANLFAFSSA
jgi:hypothetical protein